MADLTPVEIGLRSWEQQEGETDSAFTAFRFYRDMAKHERTLLAAYRLGKSKPAARYPAGAWTNWYTDHHWRERARAHDQYVDRQAEEKLIAERAEYLSNQQQIGKLLQAKGAMRFNSVNPEDLTVAQAAMLVEVGQRVQAEGLGLTRKLAVTVAPLDLDEEARQLARDRGWDPEETVRRAREARERIAKTA